MQLPLDIRLRDDATFANYAGDAARLVAAASGIVLVWGESGSGRTHLLQAACHRARASGQGSIYLCEPDRHSPEVLADLERLALVCVDDIQEVVGNEGWENALFHLINSVRDAGNTLVMSLDRPAVRLAVQLADLRSRLVAAHAIGTDDLDDASKLALLQQRASRQGFELADDVGRFILNRSDRSMRSLVELLGKLEAETLRRQKRVTIPLVKQVLGW